MDLRGRPPVGNLESDGVMLYTYTNPILMIFLFFEKVLVLFFYYFYKLVYIKKYLRSIFEKFLILIKDS